MNVHIHIHNVQNTFEELLKYTYLPILANYIVEINQGILK